MEDAVTLGANRYSQGYDLHLLRRGAMTPSTSTHTTDGTDDGENPVGDTELTDELLIEEISIDGMCGVY
jgi:mycofactocin precursor